MKKGQKMSEEQKKKIGDSHRGEKHYAFGKSHSEEHRRKIGLKMKGGNSTSFKKGHPKSEKAFKFLVGRVRSQEERQKQREARLGIKSHFWKGGRTNLKFQIKNTFQYRQWRSDIYSRDDFTCQDCNIRGGKLEAHHINPFYTILNNNKILSVEKALLCQELWNINNGMTLCRECHFKTDSYGKTQNT